MPSLRLQQLSLRLLAAVSTFPLVCCPSPALPSLLLLLPNERVQNLFADACSVKMMGLGERERGSPSIARATSRPTRVVERPSSALTLRRSRTSRCPVAIIKQSVNVEASMLSGRCVVVNALNQDARGRFAWMWSPTSA